ncbi:hypothetical protein D3C73_840830 [compost metagenome]
MDKKTYYITVASGEMLQSPEASNYDFEIQATEEDIDRLTDLFEEVEDSVQSSYVGSWIPWKTYYHEDASEAYDYYLREVYKMLHELGNEQTRKHIELMNIIH